MCESGCEEGMGRTSFLSVKMKTSASAFIWGGGGMCALNRMTGLGDFQVFAVFGKPSKL